jgi:hypothetical protein
MRAPKLWAFLFTCAFCLLFYQTLALIPSFLRLPVAVLNSSNSLISKYSLCAFRNPGFNYGKFAIIKSKACLNNYE